MATRKPRTPRKAAADPLRELEAHGPRPVYAVDGEETALVDEFLAALKDAAVPLAARDFNLEMMSGRDATLVRVLDSARTLPAFAERRLVLVSHADKLLQAPEPLLEYLNEPSPTTVLVLVADKFDARGKGYKALQKTGATVRFARPKPREMPALARRRADAKGLDVDPSALRALVDATGPDLSALDRSLELAELHRGPEERPISVEDVAAVVRSAKEESVFDLVDAIGSRDRAAALELLHRLLVVQREPALRLLALIARHLRQLLWVRELTDRGAGSEVSKVLGLPPFVADKLRGQAHRLSPELLSQGHAAVKAADRQLKGGRLADVRAMEALALKLMA